jgi:hypothetical protein
VHPSKPPLHAALRLPARPCLLAPLTLSSTNRSVL